jgi:hypothetical protein
VAAAGGREPTAFSITVFNAPTHEAVLASNREAGIHRVLHRIAVTTRSCACLIAMRPSRAS